MSEQVVLIDYQDNAIKSADKMVAHQNGWLHRAFSIFLYSGDQMLIQKRADAKYHCGGLLSNACCSHPHPDETTDAAAVRRLAEELGLTGQLLKEEFSFFYYYKFANGITEFECDHVFTGRLAADARFYVNHREVADLKWLRFDVLLNDMAANPQSYTPWFLICAPRVIDLLSLHQ